MNRFCFYTVLANVIYGMNLPYVLAHLIGDFLLQNDWQAVGKKKNGQT
jgi:hypothetical protein